MDDLGGEGAKRHAPATLRNRDAILAVLRRELPERGAVLEVASGSGEHAVFFAQNLSALDWQPSDPDAEAVRSIAAYRSEFDGGNMREPVMLDARDAHWPVAEADAVLCINMVHISPWSATHGLFRGSAEVLGEGAAVILYGPFFEADVDPAPSNLAFSANLTERNPEWRIRDVEDIDRVAMATGFRRTARYEMPANNLMLVYRAGNTET